MIQNKFSSFRTEFLVYLFFLLVILAVYYQVRSHEFVVYDDFLYVTDNPYVRDGLSSQGLHWAFSFQNKDKTYWHPLTWLSHMLDVELFGLRPGLHLLENVLIHFMSTILLFLVLKRMTGTVWRSALVAACFALHPLNVESVAWVAARKTVLSGFFWMLTLLAYDAYTRKPGFMRYMSVLLIFELGLLTKPMLVTLPCVLLLVDYWPLGRIRFSRLETGPQKWGDALVNGAKKSVSPGWCLLEKIPLLALSLISILLSSFSLQRFGAMITTADVPMDLRITNALVSYVRYLEKMVLPLGLTCHYPFPKTIPWWQPVGAALLLILICFCIVRLQRTRPYLLMGWLWYLGTLVPVIGFVQTGLWPAMADRFSYLPLIGIYVIISWGSFDLLSKWRVTGIGISATAAAMILILAAQAWGQVRYWQNSITLFKRNVAVTTDNYLSYYALGYAYERQGRLTEAVRHYRASLQIKPDQTDVHYNLASVLSRLGRREQAIAHYQQVLRIDPDDLQTHNNLGNALLLQGRLDEAIDHYQKVLQIDSEYVLAHKNLAAALLQKGMLAKAVHHYKEALRINPNDVKAEKSLKKALALMENKNEAQVRRMHP